MSENDTIQQPNPDRTTWFGHIEAWKHSGKTQRAFCHEHNLSYSSFGYWRKQYSGKKRSSQKPATHKTISALTPCKPSVPGFVTLESLPHKQLPTTSTSAMVQAKLEDLSLALPLSMPVLDMALLLRALGGRHAD